MLKKPITLISNDHHIKDGNIEEKKKLIIDKCELAKKLNINNVCLLGDIFDSRKSQTLNVLNGISEIFDIFKKYNLQCHIVPGNHCKTDYSSNNSFLDVFRFHSNINLYSDTTIVNINGIDLTFVPFWKDDILIEKLSKIKDDSVILSHFGTNGSINNDGTLHNSSITINSLKRFKKVFLGHFHQTCEITKNIIHLPSIQQNNFGEDTNKGYTVLYDDLSYEIVRSDFKVFRKVVIDADNITKEELNEAIQTYQKQSEKENIRFVFEGSEDKLKSINKERFYQVGIDVQMKNKNIEIVEDFDTIEITQYDSENIVDEFEEFCEINSYPFKEGLGYLKEKII